MGNLERKLKSKSEEEISKIKSILEVKSLQQTTGWERYLTFLSVVLPLLVPILLFYFSYLQDNRTRLDEDRYNFLAQIALSKDSNPESKKYAIEQLMDDYLLRAQDIFKIAIVESDASEKELRMAAEYAYNLALDSLYQKGELTQQMYAELISEATFDAEPDSVAAPGIEGLEKWWLYLGNYNYRWVPQKNLLGYITSLDIENIYDKPQTLKGDTITSPRTINLRKTYSTSAKVVDHLKEGDKIKVTNIEQLKRYRGSNTYRVWVEIVKL